LQVKISSGIEICQALLNALVVPNNHAQGTIKFVQCTPNACLRCHRFWRADCFRRITNHASWPTRRAVDHRFGACRNAERPMPHRHRAFL